MCDPNHTDPLSILSLMYTNGILRDRFNLLNHFSPYNFVGTIDDVPKRFDNDVAISDIIDTVCGDIISKYEKIGLSWSGGVDSTTILCALLNSLEDKSRLHVYCTKQSINEYPLMFNHLINCNVSVDVVTNIREKMGYDDLDCILGGWCADQMFGSDILKRDEKVYNLGYMDGILKTLYDRFSIVLPRKTKEQIEESVLKYSEFLNIDVREFCEFAWMFNFGVKYTFIRDIEKMHFCKTKNANKLVSFYDNIDFQRWSITHFDELRTKNRYTPKHNSAYKYPLKKYIFDYNGDSDYLLNKNKTNSWIKTSDYSIDDIRVNTDHGLFVLPKYMEEDIKVRLLKSYDYKED